jgi:glycerol-3-phosphate acyltransferase PlsY
MGYLLVRRRTGEDIRTQGSGTIGAMNVGRRLGGWAFVLIALLDMAKGVAALVIAQMLGVQGEALSAVLLTLVIGYDLPIWLRGRGGNGLAPASGALLIWDMRLFVGLLIMLMVIALLGLLLKPLGLLMPLYTPSKIAVIVAAPLAFALQVVSVMGLIGLLLSTAVILLSVAGNMRRLREERATLGLPN